MCSIAYHSQRAKHAALLGLAVVVLGTGCNERGDLTGTTPEAGELLASGSNASDGSGSQESDGDDLCLGTMDETTVDAVVVPEGKTCTLIGTRVQGDVAVKPGATLTAEGIQVEGNVQAQGHASIALLANSVVDGDVHIQQGGTTDVEDARIEGNLQVQQNTGAVHLVRNVVDGQVQANQNTGGLVIANNRISKELQCSDNNPAPTGGDNSADDKKKQCEDL